MLFPPEQTTTTDKGHGRIETRTLTAQTLTPGQVSFPFASQIFSVERIFTDYLGNLLSSEKVVGITSLTQTQASPERILNLNRGHWAIENQVHYVRDVSMGEDASRIRKGVGPRIMAIFRNLALSLFRTAGIKKIAEKITTFGLNRSSLFKFVGLCGAIKN